MGSSRQFSPPGDPGASRVRAGLHVGEIELRDEDVAGVAVHVAARILSCADADEILVSSTVGELVAGSGIEFADRGHHELKGAPGTWHLLATAAATSGGGAQVRL
jgi:class 3 adenylate cyclase